MKRFSIDESNCGSSVEGGNPSIHPSIQLSQGKRRGASESLFLVCFYSIFRLYAKNFLQTNMTSRTLTTSMTMAQQTTSHKTTTCGPHSCRQERLVENRNIKTGCSSCDLQGLIR